jgi:hypothetical protein
VFSAPGRVADLDALLRGEGDFAVGARATPWARLAVVVVVGGSLYGLAMGAFAGWEGAVYAALKVPLLVTGSMLVCLPNFYVVNAVLGLSEDFAVAARAVVSAQATLAVVLASLAPVTWFASQVTDDYHLMKLINGALFACASLCAQRGLTRHYRPLLKRNPRHRIALCIWPALYVFVALQLAYALRPFVGNPSFPTEFLRESWVGNVYLDLYWAVRGAAG